MNTVHNKMIKLKNYFKIIRDIHSSKLVSTNPRLYNMSQFTSKTKRWISFGENEKILLDIFISESETSDIICSDMKNYEIEENILDKLSTEDEIDDIEFYLRYGKVHTKYDEDLLDDIYNILKEDYNEKI